MSRGTPAWRDPVADRALNNQHRPRSTPAPPTQEDGPAVAEQDHTSGLAMSLCFLREPHRAHDWWFTSSGGGHMLDGPDPIERNVRQHHCPGKPAGSPTGRLPENTPPLPMHSVLAALEQLQSRAWGSGPVLNMHLVEVSDKTLRCAPRCAGPGEHLNEYRAADVRAAKPAAGSKS